VLLARLMSGYGRDASLNARERKAPGTVSITQLPGSPTSACRSSFFGSDAVDGEGGRMLGWLAHLRSGCGTAAAAAAAAAAARGATPGHGGNAVT
jgi:hypothetical protein